MECARRGQSSLRDLLDLPAFPALKRRAILKRPSGAGFWTFHTTAYFARRLYFFRTSRRRSCGQGYDSVAVDAGHGFGGYHGVDYGFFGGLDGGEKQGIEAVVGQHFQVVDSFGGRRSWIRGGEGDEDIARAVAGVTAIAAEA